MTINKRFEPTPKQKEYLKLLKGDKTFILAAGGSRSGKTRATIEYIFRKCLKHEGLRAVVLRQAITHARSSVWSETIAEVARSYQRLYPNLFKLNQTDLTVHFVNGSELIVGGLDDAERLEKILGREFAIIYLNESSQISFEAVNICKTRLAQVIDGFKNKFIFDCNPPSPTHWIYKTFIEKLDFKTGNHLPNPDDYVFIKMNPVDNPHLSKEYLTILDNLPDRERRRFRDGEFVKIEGAIYSQFDIDKHVIDIKDLPQIQYFTVGIDNTGTNFAAILVGWSGENIYILAEHSAFRETMQNFDADIQHKWRQYNYVAYPDPAAAQLNDLIWNAAKSDNAVEAGINYIREKINNNQFFLIRNKDGKINTPGLLAELNSYRYDDKGRIIKENDHFCLLGDTKIIVKYGLKDLKDIRIGDEVLTEKGWRKVLDSQMTSPSASVILHQEQNLHLIGTPDHPVFQNGKRTPLKDACFNVSDTIKGVELCKKERAKLLYGMVRDIIKQNIIHIGDYSFQKKQDTYIEMFGSFLTALFQKDGRFTTRIKIQIIMILKILSAALQKTTKLIIQTLINQIKKLMKKLPNGIDQKREEDGMRNMEEENTSLYILLKNVLYATRLLLLKTVEKQQEKPVQTHVQEYLDIGIKYPVYNLTVEDTHSYYANGILVSNCDSMRYCTYSHAKYGASIIKRISI